MESEYKRGGALRLKKMSPLETLENSRRWVLLAKQELRASNVYLSFLRARHDSDTAQQYLDA